MNTLTSAIDLSIPEEFQNVFTAQQAAYRKQMNPTLQERQADLRTLHRMIVENSDAIIAAINQDYGCRCTFETKFTEVLMAQDAALDAVKKLKKWIKPQKRHLDPTQFPLAKAWTFPQPVGVIGIVVPWNFPLAMAIQPLICAFAAGNRAMIKMSENSNHLALLLKEVSPRYFPLDKLAFFEDGNGRGPVFTTLAFDHIFFTGSPGTGKAVMANAAKNLTPVTLELGGKSPCIVAPDFSAKTAAERVLWAKMLNAGQICTNVDYLLLPANKVEEFVSAARALFNQRIPDINSGDYTAVIDQRSYDRLEATLADAVAKGARVIDLYQGPAPKDGMRLMPTRLVLDVTDDMLIMQREIFGPLLPIRTYQSKEEVCSYINERPRPLALYIYSNDKALQDYYLNNTISGGVGINESVIQAGLHDLPFGGSGNSGMGHYHSLEGFLTFSKLRPVFKQGPVRGIDLFLPPYAGWSTRILDFMLKMKS
ncbi:coniferyl aldehyde dehydrogenase [Pseudomonas sp. N040]|uniref:coniferyl aldehyde dehydrogenase n=1 Tax=Pseudomonas sp. N040 TaxID=2785325 RepID=UPI0018A27A40|nr:coniferyl aldehyde dehydrogenase [Pseudomonas sp. N040]MBF7729271.1 coniferyl aldehyde dehydrogenase [Pseudomonas sp. N040]MBW7012911.1 coniferyl aldehyde dehydrogenase [Pseudomonas sp. N040]